MHAKGKEHDMELYELLGNSENVLAKEIYETTKRVRDFIEIGEFACARDALDIA